MMFAAYAADARNFLIDLRYETERVQKERLRARAREFGASAREYYQRAMGDTGWKAYATRGEGVAA
jgi:hypothetical protein